MCKVTVDRQRVYVCCKCMKEREASARLFRGKEGQQLVREIGKRAKTFVPGAPVVQHAAAAGAGPAAAASASAKQNIDAIKVCLLKSDTVAVLAGGNGYKFYGITAVLGWKYSGILWGWGPSLRYYCSYGVGVSRICVKKL